MALHDRDILRTMAFGIAGLSVVADSLSAIRHAKVHVIRDATGLAVDYRVEGEFPTFGNADASVDDIAADLESAAKKHGYQIVASGEYAPGSKDFSDLILKAKSAGAETVLALPSPPDGMTIVKQMKELDLNAKVDMFIRAADPPVWSQNLSKDGDYVLLSPGWHFAAKYPKVAELNEAHQKLFNRPSDPLVGPSYACLQILADALTRAKTLDRDKLRDAIAATNMTTVAGPVRFRSDGTGEVKVFFLQWLKGKQELVWPKEFATAPFGYPAPEFSQR